MKQQLNQDNYNLLVSDGKTIRIEWIKLFRNEFLQLFASAVNILKRYKLVEELERGSRTTRRSTLKASSNTDNIMGREEHSPQYANYKRELGRLQNIRLQLEENVQSEYAAYDQDKVEHLKVISIANLHFTRFEVPYLLVPKP